MQKSNELIQQMADGLKHTPRTTAADKQQNQPTKDAPSHQQIDAINQVFALFRINYHNQYYKAFSDTETLTTAKRLWIESLHQFDAEALLKGAKRAIETSEYLPTLKKMIDCCQGDMQSHGLPSARIAYIEACRAPSPKSAYSWSHPAIYHAGKLSDWHFLGHNSEYKAFPVFEKNYQQLCERIMHGETLAAPTVPALPETIEKPLSKAENLARMKIFKKELRL